MSDPLDRLEARIGHVFKDRAHLLLALTHPSWQQDNPAFRGNNQRLEFLGDAVVHLIVSEALYREFPREREGGLTHRRSALANGAVLTQLATEIDLASAVRLGSSEEATGGRTRASTIEDAFEALIGAVYLDAGLEVARRVVLGIYGDLGARLATLEYAINPKGRLQEIVQPSHGNGALRYDSVKAGGLDHSLEFTSSVYLKDRLLGTGQGSSKKLAEEAAARMALLKYSAR
ncbi:MAG: ribonuclease III [Opitutaceae bacterium]|nr:ribonuclease III [Opitutaceae bacterium]